MFRELPEDFSSIASSIVDREADSVLLRTARFDWANRKSYLFQDCRETLVARSLADIPAVFAAIEAALDDGCYVAGFLSYECGAHFEPRALTVDPAPALPGKLPLAWFGVYPSPLIFEHNSGDSSALNPEVPPLPLSVVQGPAGMTNPLVGLEGIALDIPALEYRDRIERITRYIEAGDTYQVNFTTGVRMPYSGTASALFSRLLKSQPVAYGALLNFGETQIVSASPELFFQLRDGEITTRPMKGTAARGKDLDEDAAIASWLEHDEKNRSENVMIVDLLRNDLGRVCLPGSIQVEKLFAVERYRTLFQMTSTVSGRLQPGIDFYRIFRALFPSGSIVGAPKVRTMQIIQELEGSDQRPRHRGIYTGAIGFISPRREAVFSVAIRTLVLRDGMAEMGVGSGIVYDSDAEAEYEECRLKAAFLVREPVEFQLIETMLWDREYFLLSLHLERLAASAAYFDFRFDHDEIWHRLTELQRSFTAGSRYKVRLLLFESGSMDLSYVLIEEASAPLKVMLATERVSSSDLYLRHKTTRRALYDRGYQEAVALGFDDALFLNERGELAECAIHSIFVERDGRWATPLLAAGVLPGVYRRHLLETRQNTSEQSLTPDDLRAADRVFLCNSVRGLSEVGCIHLDGKIMFSRLAVAIE
jgi:para-aminobenzoate synthetase / 4-amino-4-deoxychorismate lyase